MNAPDAESSYRTSAAQHSALLSTATNLNYVLRPECIECGAEPNEPCFAFCGNGCQACVDEAAGNVGGPPHSCEDEW